MGKIVKKQRKQKVMIIAIIIVKYRKPVHVDKRKQRRLYSKKFSDWGRRKAKKIQKRKQIYTSVIYKGNKY